MALRRPTADAFLTIAIVGRGRVGRALAKSLGRGRPTRNGRTLDVSLVSGRNVESAASRSALLRAAVVWLAVPDAAVEPTCARIATLGVLARSSVVLHAAGALGLDALAPLRGRAHLGALHPLVSFADVARPPPIAGSTFVAEGSARAIYAARVLARGCDAHLLVASNVDRALYHAAAALLANGAAALAVVSLSLAERAGLARDSAAVRRALAGLLASVAHNVAVLGPEAALTGPIARGDAEPVRRHLARIDAAAPDASHVYRDVGRAILTVAHARGLDDDTATLLRALLAPLRV